MARKKKSLLAAVSKEIQSKFDLNAFKNKKGLDKNIKFKKKEHLTNYYKYLLFQNLVENFESNNSKFLQKFDGANLTRKREKF